jgi:hypothetical protein
VAALAASTRAEARGGFGPGLAGGLIAGAVIGGIASNSYGHGPGYGYYGGYGPGFRYAPAYDSGYAPAYYGYGYRGHIVRPMRTMAVDLVTMVAGTVDGDTITVGSHAVHRIARYG